MLEVGGTRNSGPVFVVGAPRSGTSILTWCLGQHPNILPQEESGWMGEFAINVGVQYQIGSSRGDRSQLSAMGISRDAFFRIFGDGINAMILGNRTGQEEVSRNRAHSNPSHCSAAFSLSRSVSDTKLRWVDGTPEYSYYIAALRKLFPDAKFVHIVRDVRSVVNSMLHFKMDGGRSLVETERQAYEYWLGTVQSCVQAERAFGPQVVHRVRYDDLVNRPEWVIKGVLEFLDEPYTEACLRPLVNRINSSCVPEGFDSTDERTPIGLIERARRLSGQLQRPDTTFPMSEEALAKIEEKVDQRVSFMRGLDVRAVALTRSLNWCGAILAGYMLLLAILCGFILLIPDYLLRGTILFLLAYSIGSVVIYATVRGVRLRDFAHRVHRRLVGE